MPELKRFFTLPGGQVAAWGNVISALRRCVLPYLSDSQMLRRAGVSALAY